MTLWKRLRSWLLNIKDSRPEPELDEFQATMATALEDFLAIMPPEYTQPDCFIVGEYWRPALIEMRVRRFMDYPVLVDDQIGDEVIYLKGAQIHAADLRAD